jgi:5'-nucleotidase
VTRQGFRDGHVRHWRSAPTCAASDYYWMGFRHERSKPAEGTDLKAVYEGRISVTPLHIDLTHNETVHALKGVLGGAPPGLAKA